MTPTTIWHDKPIAVLGVVQTALVLAVTFGIELTREQTGAVLAFAAAMLTLIGHTQVTPFRSAAGDEVHQVDELDPTTED